MTQYRTEREFEVPVSRIWQAFTDAEILVRWSCGDWSTRSTRKRSLEAPSSAVVELDFRTSKAGTTLHITHSGLPQDSLPTAGAHWSHLLDALEASL